MKYIRQPDDRIVMFDATMEHKAVKLALEIEVKSAGYFMIIDGNIVVSGGSHSLQISGLPDDDKKILEQLAQ
jgi:hypothetical protein